MRLRGALLAAFCLGAVLCLWGVFVLSHRGQVLEAAALKGSEIGAHYVTGHARTLLSVVSMPAAGALGSGVFPWAFSRAAFGPNFQASSTGSRVTS